MKGAARFRSQAGMTLTELVVVSAILVALNAIIYGTFRFESETYRRELARGATVGELRTWMARMVRDVRNARYDPLGTAGAAISAATPTDLEFAVDFDGNGTISSTDAKETMGYRLSGGSLERRQGTTWRTIINGVTDFDLTYYDYRGVQVNATSPYTSYVDISHVRISLTAEATDASTAVTETSFSSIRNPNPL